MSKRHQNKQTLINLFDKKCAICGYDKHQAALQFHHRDPAKKNFNISKYAGNNKITYEFARELEQVVLLCANCHACVHAGLFAEELAAIPEMEIDLEDVL